MKDRHKRQAATRALRKERRKEPPARLDGMKGLTCGNCVKRVSSQDVRMAVAHLRICANPQAANADKKVTRHQAGCELHPKRKEARP